MYAFVLLNYLVLITNVLNSVNLPTEHCVGQRIWIKNLDKTVHFKGSYCSIQQRNPKNHTANYKMNKHYLLSH